MKNKSTKKEETMNTYLITNNKNSDSYTKDFLNTSEARHWIINHLDLSNEWSINPVKKLHHTAYKKNYKNYILSTIEEDGEGKPLTTESKKIDYIFDRFNSEYGFMIERVGKYKAMSEWLSGLALDIEYYDDAIVDLAIKMGSINPNPNDKLKNTVAANYWDFMANIILGFEPKKQAA
jgi:hypothetical protein